MLYVVPDVKIVKTDFQMDIDYDLPFITAAMIILLIIKLYYVLVHKYQHKKTYLPVYCINKKYYGYVCTLTQIIIIIQKYCAIEIYAQSKHKSLQYT